MVRTRWTTGVVAALATVTLAMAAGTAQAQDYMSRSSRASSSSMSSGPHFAIGTEVWGDHRGIIYKSADFTFVGVASNTLDEHALETLAENSIGHVGTFADLLVNIGGDIPMRFGLRIGSFIGLTRAVSWFPGTQRTVTDVVTRPGLAGGILADIQYPLPSGMWLGGTLDFYVGQASIEGQPFNGATAAYGDYFFLLPEFTARLGFRIQDSGASPFIGFSASYYQGKIKLEDEDTTTALDLQKLEATANNWTGLKIVLGVQFDGGPIATRFQLGIWNPGRDFGASLQAVLTFG